MKILAEIDRTPNVPHIGNIVTREAVRGIILKGDQILLIHSIIDGDYKFPGGGVQKEESHFEALKREIAEESGAVLLAAPNEFGKVIEYDRPIEKNRDVFRMTSYYYLCQVDPTLGMQDLEDYEAELGFTPVWVTINEAVQNNRELLNDQTRSHQRWVKRETIVLELVRDQLTRKATHVQSNSQ